MLAYQPTCFRRDFSPRTWNQVQKGADILGWFNARTPSNQIKIRPFRGAKPDGPSCHSRRGRLGSFCCPVMVWLEKPNQSQTQKLISFSVQRLLSPREWHLSLIDIYQYIHLMSVCPYSIRAPLAIQCQSHPIPAGPGSLFLRPALDVLGLLTSCCSSWNQCHHLR